VSAHNPEIITNISLKLIELIAEVRNELWSVKVKFCLPALNFE